MLEILVLILLCKRIGDRAGMKGLPKRRWILKTIGAWLLFEFLGVFFAIIIFGPGNIFAVYSIGIMSAFGGYLFVSRQLDKEVPKPNN